MNIQPGMNSEDLPVTISVALIDENARGECLRRQSLKLSGERLTIAEIISQRVAAEVKLFNLQRPVRFRALVTPRGAEESDQGFRLPRHCDQDEQQHIKAALDAFEQKLFFVLVAGKEYKSLQDCVDLSDGIEISFIKLMPVLAG